MHQNEEFLKLLDQMREIHRKKNDDYSSAGPDENFERMAVIQGWFSNPIDKSFVGMVAVKLARLGVLLSKNGKPNNESVEDSFLDLCTYCCLWAANYTRRNKKNVHGYGEMHRQLETMGGHLRGCLWDDIGKRYNCIVGCRIKAINDGAENQARQVDLRLPLEIRPVGVFSHPGIKGMISDIKEMDPRIEEIFNICYELPEDKLALVTAEARRMVM